MAQPVRFQATVEHVTRHAPDVATYRLRSERRLPAFSPGQFIHLTLDPYDPAGFWPESRVFSVANAVADRRTVELTISRQGAYTSRILDRLRPGAQVWGKGPYGEFTIGAADGVRRAVLIAGGTGITPFCAFMDAALSEGKLPLEEVVLHYGARTPALLIYRSLSDACASRLPGFRVHYHAEVAAPGDAPVQPGRLDPRVIVADLGDARETAFYLSGPKDMIDGFKACLVGECGVPPERVLVDAWE
jgi:ferredoxin-NADP reductase